MKRVRSRSLIALGAVISFGVIILLNACKHEPPVAPQNVSGYPDAVAKIIVTKCATAGCHNALSYVNASGILLDTWDHLFNGGNSGATVIPFDIINSSLLSFINVDSTEGLRQVPTMPLNMPPLSKAEYATIRDWIAAGAPDKGGHIPFADNPATRQKVYITAQGCDLMHVVDAQRNVIMRNISIGKEAGIESPHCVRVSEDGQYAYTCFIGGNWVQKIDTRTDKIVGEVQISGDANSDSTSLGSASQWNILNVSRDGKKLIVADYSKDTLKIITTDNMQVIQKIYGPNGTFSFPHGMASNAAFDTIYITSQLGNTVYKISPTGFKKNVAISNTTPFCQPHEIMLTPDDSKYFVTCQFTNEVRVMDAHTDQLLHVFPVPDKPQELAISRLKHLMFVTCIEAPNPTNPYLRGAVVVIDYNTMQVVNTIYGDFYQPHGITVDDQAGKVFITSTNFSTSGAAPHHVSSCAGRIGWYSVYDLNTLQPVNTQRYETSVYPYSADVRFKGQ